MLALRNFTIGAALVGSWALWACEAAPETAQPSRASNDATAGPTLALYAPQPTHDAWLEARLVSSGGCLFLQARDGTTCGVAWRADKTRWDSATSEIVGGNSRAAVGDFVFVGGGGADITPENVADSGWGWIEAPRAECLGDSFWIADSISKDRP